MKKMRLPKIKGLYAVTPDIADTERLCSLVDASLQGGASIIQYRNKDASATLRAEQADALLRLCRSRGVAFIINDHLNLCLSLDADGVHLGADDGNLAKAKSQLGNHKILGVSCYNRLELAQEAKAQGADYVAFGSCFYSGTKPAAVHAPLELISRARTGLRLPIVAIGGITLENAGQAINAGADAIAVIGALFKAANVTLTAQQFSNLFTNTPHHDLSQPATL
ncbi:MAG: thiamine phosphate synthase [Methylophilaceae bacterium]